MSEPRFRHDCEDCLYLGSYGGRDIYRCPQSGMATIVARYGDDGAEYESGPLLWLRRRNDAEKDALGFEATDTSIRIHNSDGVFNLADGTSTICLNPWTAELIESLPQDIRESPFLPLALDEIELRPFTPQTSAWLTGDVRARMAALRGPGGSSNARTGRYLGAWLQGWLCGSRRGHNERRVTGQDPSRSQ